MLKSQLPRVEKTSSEIEALSGTALLVLIILVVIVFMSVVGASTGLFGLPLAVTLIAVSVMLFGLWCYVAFLRKGSFAFAARPEDNELLGQLVDLNRRATVLTDLRGRSLASNAAFEKLTDNKDLGLGDILKGDTAFRDFSQLVTQIRRQGNGEDMFTSSLTHEAEVTLSGRRIGAYILWEIRGEGVEARIKREIAFISGWARPILEASESGVLLQDKSGQVRYINSVMRKWLFLGESDALPDKLSLKADMSELVSSGGHRISVDCVTIPLSTREGGWNIGQLVILKNLETSHTAHIGIEGRAYLAHLLDAAPLAIAVIGMDGQIIEQNRPMKRLTRHIATGTQVEDGGEPEKNGRKISEDLKINALFEEEDAEKLSRAIEEAQIGKTLAKPLDLRLKGSIQKSGQVHLASAADAEDRYTLLYLTDTTQERQLEQQFVQAQKMQAVGQLAGGIAHDFNNLLTAIIGFCDLLLMRHDTGDQSFSDLIQIQQNANRAANLVRQLLAFSRQQTMRPAVLDLTDVIADLIHLVRRLIGDRIILKVTHGRTLPQIKADQGQLEQVIINLAVNARDAMPSGGDLNVRTREINPGDPIFEEFDVILPAKYVLIEVEDTGVGISEENQEKIFEPFFTTKAVGEGTGLGLATVYGIVKQTGGYVFCRSEVGVGTSFLVLLRAHEGEEAAKSRQDLPEEEVKDLTGSGTILLVEDEDPVRMFAARALSSKGYQVIEAASGLQAVEYVEDENLDISLMITDVVMPEMDGPALAMHARTCRAEMPVIFISGYAEDMLRRELEDDRNYFLAKPFSLKSLAEMVKEIIGK